MTNITLSVETSCQSRGSAHPAPVVFMKHGRVFADSREVAAVFGKNHFHVLRDIRNLIVKEPNLARTNFGAFKIKDLTGESTSHYEMDRDGFTLLAMGFTGSRALKWKLAYIRAFNDMEARLGETHTPAPPSSSVHNPGRVARFGDLPIRVFAYDGRVWFSAAAVCAALGLDLQRRAVAELDKVDVALFMTDESADMPVTAISSEGAIALTRKVAGADARRLAGWIKRQTTFSTKPNAKPENVKPVARLLSDSLMECIVKTGKTEIFVDTIRMMVREGESSFDGLRAEYLHRIADMAVAGFKVGVRHG